jgi:hypothetical protein
MKKKWMIYIVIMTLIVIIIGMVYQSQVHPLCRGRFIVHCFDEEGKPMPGVNLDVSYAYHRSRGYQSNIFQGTTDRNGNLVVAFSKKAERKWDHLYLRINSRSPRYYITKLEIPLERKGKEWKSIHPEYNFYFRKIIEPVPMYAKKVNIVLPTLNTPVGYDLLVGDWVKPHGQGMVSDLLISLKKSWKKTDDNTVELNITFPNSGDGVAQIKPLWFVKSYDSDDPSPMPARPSPWQAALDGYTDKLIQKTTGWGKKTIDEYIPKRGGYGTLRIRTEHDIVGEVKAGMYGTLQWPVNIYDLDSPTARLVFSYKVNPNGSRIIEFHSSKNLFKNLKPEEQYINYFEDVMELELPALRQVPKQEKQPFAD